MKNIIRSALHLGASDVHLPSGLDPFARVDGDIRRLTDFGVLESERLTAGLDELIGEAACRNLKDKDVAVVSPDVPGVRMRVNLHQADGGIGAAIRFIPTTLPRREDIGVPADWWGITRCAPGLVLVVGATGQGKSTTLAAALDDINCSQKKHILSLEDPIEFVHRRDGTCLVTQREIGKHTPTFVSGLRSALRERPDFLLIGELRDKETMSLALTMALSGHRVFATVHAGSAAQGVHRFVDAFPPGEKEFVAAMLAESLSAVIAQKLVKGKDGKQVAAREVLIATDAVRNIVRQISSSAHSGVANSFTGPMQSGRDLGMQTMEQALVELCRSGQISRAVALEHGVAAEALAAAGVHQWG